MATGRGGQGSGAALCQDLTQARERTDKRVKHGWPSTFQNSAQVLSDKFPVLYATPLYINKLKIN